jgi:hypothetical protein
MCLLSRAAEQQLGFDCAIPTLGRGLTGGDEMVPLNLECDETKQWKLSQFCLQSPF